MPFIFATGYGSAGIEAAWNVVPVLQKPFQVHDLAVAIEQSSSRSGLDAVIHPA